MLTAADLDRIEKALAHAHKRDPIGFGAECAVILKAGDLRALVAHCRATVGAELLPAELREIEERWRANIEWVRSRPSDPRGRYQHEKDIDFLLADAVAMRNMLADALEERGGFRQGFEAAKAGALDAAHYTPLPYGYLRYEQGEIIRKTLAAAVAALSAEEALAELRRAGR